MNSGGSIFKHKSSSFYMMVIVRRVKGKKEEENLNLLVNVTQTRINVS